MQPKSNFDFLKETKFLNSLACQDMYECAICVENLYKNNKEYCALKARLFLDNFIHYVVKLKNLEFPQKPLSIGSYYTEPNAGVFHSVFGNELTDCIISINRASKPYLHTDIPREDGLFKDIVKIKSSVDFSKTKVTNLGSLKSIIGDALFNHSSVVNLGDLKMITGNAEFQNAQFTTLNNLEYIGGNANFSYSNIKDLGKLKTIQSSADFINSDITSLNKPEYILH